MEILDGKIDNSEIILSVNLNVIASGELALRKELLCEDLKERDWFSKFSSDNSLIIKIVSALKHREIE